MTNKTKTAAGVGLCIALAASLPATAELSESEMNALISAKISVVETLAFHPRLVAAVKRQNAEGLSSAEIEQRDQAWAADGQNMFKHAMINSDVSSVLSAFVRENDFFTEAFLTDNQGANVAAFPATSDYWQGDEEKWTASYNDGAGRLFIGEVEFDDSTGTNQVQVSAPVIDVVNNETLGVLVMGVTLDNFNDAE